MGVIELSTGHVFAPGSVKVIGPLTYGCPLGDYAFEILGVGFKFTLTFTWNEFGAEWADSPLNHPDDDALLECCRKKQKDTAERVRQEAINKLLGGQDG